MYDWIVGMTSGSELYVTKQLSLVLNTVNLENKYNIKCMNNNSLNALLVK